MWQREGSALKSKTRRLSSILKKADVVVPEWGKMVPCDGHHTTKTVPMARSSDRARDIGAEAESDSNSNTKDENGFQVEGALTSADAGLRSSKIEKSEGRLRRKKACGRKKIRMSNFRFRRDAHLLKLTRGHYKGPYHGDDDKNTSSSGRKGKQKNSERRVRVLTLHNAVNGSDDDFEYLSTVMKETSYTKMQLLSGRNTSNVASNHELSPKYIIGMQEDSGSKGRVEDAAFQNDDNEVARGRKKKESSEDEDKEGRVVVSGHVASFDLNETPSSSEVDEEEDGNQILDFDLNVPAPTSNVHDTEEKLDFAGVEAGQKTFESLEKTYCGHENLLCCDDNEAKNETCVRQCGVGCKRGEAVIGSKQALSCIGSNEVHRTMKYFKKRENFKKKDCENTKPLVAIDNEDVKKISPSATGMLGSNEVERTMRYFRRRGSFKKKSCDNHRPLIAIDDEDAKKTSTSGNEKVQIGYCETQNSLDSSDYLPISYMRRKVKKGQERTDQYTIDTWEPELQQCSNATDESHPNSLARNQTALEWTENMGSGSSVLQDGLYSGQLISPRPPGNGDTNLPTKSIGMEVCENPPSITSAGWKRPAPPSLRSGKTPLHKVKASLLKREEKSRHLQALQILPRIRVTVSSNEIQEDWMQITGHKYEGPRQTTKVPKGKELCKALVRPHTIKYLDEIDFNN